MDEMREKSEDSLLDELTTHLLSVSISLVPTFSLSISSPPTCSHTERGINPSHFHYLSLSISVALSATSFWPFSTNRNTLAVGTNERVSLQSHSNHTTSSLGLF